MGFQQLKPANQGTIALIIAASCITGVTAYVGISKFQQRKLPEKVQTPLVIRQVSALGRLEPSGEVSKLSVPASLSNDRVAELLVKRGDRVKADQTIAIMNSRDRLQNVVLEAQEQLKVSLSELAKVKAGAKPGQIDAQQATIARLKTENSTQIEAQRATIARLEAEQETEIAAQKASIKRLQAELNNAQTEYQRNEKLFLLGAISASLRDSKRLAQQTAQQQLAEAQANLKRIQSSGQEQINEAKATLNQIAEVRSVDVQAAQTLVDKANAAIKKAKSDLADAYIKAPMASRILEINAKPGEVVGSKGIVDLGQTDQMEVIAEVYQSDIDKIREGKQAIITSESFSGEIGGTVREIGVQVTPQEVSSGQPGENLDRKVVKVRIRLNPESSRRVANLTNLQVQVAIKI